MTDNNDRPWVAIHLIYIFIEAANEILNFNIVIVSPKIKTNPEGKVRMKGQNVMLCCEAIGRPNPSKYVW